MNERLVKAFSELDVNNKRDKISRELMVIGDHLKQLESTLGIANETDIYNYNPLNDNNQKEGEFLTSIYQDIFNIEREVLNIIKIIEVLINSVEQEEIEQ